MLAQAEEPVEWVYFIMENAPSGLDKSKKPVDKILGRREPAGLGKSIGLGVHVIMLTVHGDAAVIHSNNRVIHE